MATYSVFRQDDDGEADPNRVPPLVAYRLEPNDEPQQGTTPATIGRRESGLPCVVLRLPDLSQTDGASDGWWPRLSNRLFWVGIGLGALVALLLIWTPKKEQSPALDEAPTWSGPSAAPAVPPTQAQSDAPAAANVAPANPYSATPSVRTARSGSAVWDGRAPSSFETPSQPSAAQQSATPAWPPQVPDAPPQQAPAVRPGEAAPTGINPW
jgi:hypothetical protein